VLLVAQVEHEDHFAETGRFVVFFQHEVRVAGVQEEGDQGAEGSRVDEQLVE
jgi:hypothetical protein